MGNIVFAIMLKLEMGHHPTRAFFSTRNQYWVYFDTTRSDFAGTDKEKIEKRCFLWKTFLLRIRLTLT